MKITKFQDIPKFPRAYYRVDVSLKYLPEQLEQWDRKETPLILDPEWQRGHVWSKDQQISYMEYILKGGTTGKEFYFNCSSWSGMYNTPIYCVDGLQRLTAAKAFLNNEIPVFNSFYKEFEDRLRMIDNTFSFNMLNLKNKKELLGVYINFNSGGTPHNPEELKRVQKMLDNTDESETL